MDEPPENETAAPMRKAAGSGEEAKSDSQDSRLVASGNSVPLSLPRFLGENSAGRTAKNLSRTTSSRSPLGMTECEIGFAERMGMDLMASETKRQRTIGGIGGRGEFAGQGQTHGRYSQTGTPGCQPKEPVAWT